MGWISDMTDRVYLWPKKLFSSEGRSELWRDVKNGEGYAGIGSPLHGLSAGYAMTKLGSGYRAKQAYDRIQDGQNPLSSEFIRGLGHDQSHNIQDAFKENWPVLAVMGGGLLGGSGGGAGGGAGSGGPAAGGGGLAIGADGSIVAAGTEGSSALTGPAFAGGGSSGGGLSSLLQGGAGLLGGMGGGGQQQQPTVVQAPAQQQQDQSARIRLMQAVRLQALRQKPNKTLEEWAELQNAIENEGLLA